ncbi:hypothetical protein BB559_005188 [Furculomyces boomerangus]|uniref:Uncharacterized protein n=2 Tax=Harpellales TaxID=61421 RepID=A0A2T9YA68_9FUNG|nr:hypothetical protein BB559_005188 [Furculomyces boomerangus]PWA03424.1 hypothetical protein BB558_000408 [Smittium angustum]
MDPKLRNSYKLFNPINDTYVAQNWDGDENKPYSDGFPKCNKCTKRIQRRYSDLLRQNRHCNDHNPNPPITIYTYGEHSSNNRGIHDGCDLDDNGDGGNGSDGGN